MGGVRRFACCAATLGLVAGGLVTAGASSASATAACTTTCYVSPSGAGTMDGTSAANALQSIQAGINAVNPSGTVRVLPGDYSETAANSSPTSIGGTYTFGLFISSAKSGITVEGVTAGDAVITDPNSVVANITTNSDANFGPDGTFVEGDNVTLQGLHFLPNTGSENKTIENVGDNFKLKYSSVDDENGALYIDDFRYNAGTDVSHVQSYTIDHNKFPLTAIVIASGAGKSGAVSGRQITNNTFTNDATLNYPSISVRGAGGQPWYQYPVGGMQITGNTFSNTQSDGIYIRTTQGPDYNNGNPNPYDPNGYDNSQFDWNSIFRTNVFTTGAQMVLQAPGNPRTYSQSAHLSQERRISVSEPPFGQPNTIAQSGDTIVSWPIANCTTTCYAAPGGTGIEDGSSPANALPTIQSAIDAVSPSGSVHVLPGNYSETAPNSTLATGGTYTFGLFIGSAKSGITVEGVTAGDVPITDPNTVAANITTNSTADFGPDGTMVEADGVTLQGLHFLPNTVTQNKTIEVIGDAFTLKYSNVDDENGALYIDDFRYNAGTNVSHVQSYTIDHNKFPLTAIVIASGAGATGAVSGRQITNNTFTNDATLNYPSISIRGAGGQPWYTYPVGGLQISGNNFTNSQSDGIFIRTSQGPDYNDGNGGPNTANPYYPNGYNNSQFDWASIFANNTYAASAQMVLISPPGNVRSYSDHQYTRERRIAVHEPDSSQSTTIADNGDTIQSWPPPALPGAPTGVSAGSGNASATVSFTPPVSDGGSGISGYTATCSATAQTTRHVTAGGSPITVNSLTNGVQYSCTVHATNVEGNGPESSAALVTPATVPDKPTGVAATAGNLSATVTWTAPANTGGSTITGYTATASPGGQTCSWTTGPLTCTVTGLTGQPYTFTVVATNAVGSGAASDPSSPVTPTTNSGPGAPTGAAAAAGNVQAVVTWAAPASDGGSAITGYTATSSPGGQTCSATAPTLTCTVNGLTNGTNYTFTVVATNGVGPGAPSAPSNQITPFPWDGHFNPLVPARILDTRFGVGHTGKVGSGQSFDLQVTGQGAVPASGVSAVIMNVTATGPDTASFLTVWPAGVTQPVASNLNFVTGQTVANLVTVKVGAGGKVSFFNGAGNTDVVADVVGWYSDTSAASGSRLQPVVPARILDTRSPLGHAGPVGPGQSFDLQVTGQGGVPANGVTAVVMNVTATGADSPSFLTVWPAGVTRPVASNLNFVAGATVPNLVTVKVGAGGKVSFFNGAGNVHVVADVVGWYSDTSVAGGSRLQPVVPARILDTRNGTGHTGQVGPGQSFDLQVTGAGGVPGSGVSAVVMNVTVTGPDASSFLTVWPAGVAQPVASNLNFGPFQTVPNLVVVQVGAGGKVSFFNGAGNVHVVADVVGWFKSTP